MPDLELLVFLGVALIVAAVGAVLLRRWALRQRAEERLFGVGTAADDTGLEAHAVASRVPRGSVVLGVVAGSVVALALWTLLDMHPTLSVAFGLLAGVLTWTAHGIIVENRTLRIETELANAIDYIVASLRAGASILDALDGAAREVRQPLRRVLEAAVGRLRLGESPAEVFRDLHAAMPLDSVRLFTQAPVVQWQTGGSLAPAMTAAGRSVRDRIEITRRVRAQTAEVHFSAIAVLFIIYGIALISWNTAADRVEAFVASDVGGGLLAACVALQAAGVYWLVRLGRVLN